MLPDLGFAVQRNRTPNRAKRSRVINDWEKLTLFLREPGGPLDNNVCERALKKDILRRKNALFYRGENRYGVLRRGADAKSHIYSFLSGNETGETNWLIGDR
jgi:Transposase IS66 family